MEQTARVAEIIGPSITDMGYDLVRVQLSGDARPKLQVMAERLDGAAMTVDDCADISRAVSALLDVEDPISGAYTLEVSSPGIDRPLVKLKDFERFAGFEAKVEMRTPIDGRKHFSGRLLGIENENVQIKTSDDNFDLPHADIHRAKLIMTDDLLAAAKEQGQ